MKGSDNLKNIVKSLMERSVMYETSLTSSDEHAFFSKDLSVETWFGKIAPSEYSVGDEVYVKCQGKGKIKYRGEASIAAPRVLEEIVIATNNDLHKYKARYTTQEKTISSDWFRVDMITTKIASQEREKQQRANENAKRGTINLLGKNNKVFDIIQEINDIIIESRVMSTSCKIKCSSTKSSNRRCTCGHRPIIRC
ncbi:unnamed protein product [Mytilus coruscus]|uniref:Uncharacterized protein n=1 Tax=Mytilus coruscus TaxID=42192 RepID=A0A6J8BE12_MYTCO|nr:unnamed protein product [Mytilus coruscus]